MFRDPDPLTEQVSQALLGMEVAVVETRPGWSRIRTPDAYQGWIVSEALVPAPEDWTSPWREVEDLWANLRARNDHRQAAVVHAPIGTGLPQVDESEGRVQLLLPDGRRLWTETHRTLPAPVKRSQKPSAIVRTARRFLGIPYLWGGCSPWGLDCSGFCQLVFRLHGIAIQRDADQQMAQGAPIADPDTADLVFFGPEDRPERITHVGMMLDRRRYIHAKGSACVRINALDPMSGGYRGARRFVAGR
jgi:cell wall-associated NlpC family hydrolase